MAVLRLCNSWISLKMLLIFNSAVRDLLLVTMQINFSASHQSANGSFKANTCLFHPSNPLHRVRIRAKVVISDK